MEEDPVFEIMKSTGVTMQVAMDAIERANGDLVEATVYALKPNYIPANKSCARIDPNAKNQEALKKISKLRQILNDLSESEKKDEEREKDEIQQRKELNLSQNI